MRESRTNARCASRGSRALRAAAVAIALLVPGLAAADEIDARMDRLHDRFQQCTRQHGYDPQSLGSTGPHEVAPDGTKREDPKEPGHEGAHGPDEGGVEDL